MKYLGISARSCRGNFAPRFRQNQDIFEKPSKKNFAASRENKNFPSRKDAKFLSISHGDTEARSFLSANNPLHLRLNHSQIFVAIRGFFFFTFLKTSRLGGFARKQKPANPVLNRLAGDLKWCGWRSRTLQLPFK